MTKRQLAELLAAFAKEHGVEETTGILSRFLLGLAHGDKMERLEFTDIVGSVSVIPKQIEKRLVN